ncbi:hypothetical protein [Roseiconus lacunae]|uniref:Uncharacterized protein n=1 Tax=Roseiconus lacunae TaxID=2605694 RepID=A0ABT7PIP6_9BACT|nr:hypothetical protein [Roseiconus lacunae]MDM4016066.1 hypothetical protein [Roseiconus lacunae]
MFFQFVTSGGDSPIGVGLDASNHCITQAYDVEQLFGLTDK